MAFSYSTYKEWLADNPNGTMQDYNDAKAAAEQESQAPSKMLGGISGAVSGTMKNVSTDTKDTGGDDTGKVIKNISPMLSAIPVVGSFLSGIGTVFGGAIEADSAARQKSQAEKVRNYALQSKAQEMQSEYGKHLRLKEMAALSGLPGLQQHQQALEAQGADTARAIRESSNGAATLAAIVATQGLQNQSLSDIMAKNEAYKSDALKDVGSALLGIGGEKQSLQDKADAVKRQGLQAASAFDAASTYNKMGGINKILGALTSTAGSLTKNAGEDNKASNDALINKMLQDYLAKNQTSTTSLDPSAVNSMFSQHPM